MVSYSIWRLQINITTSSCCLVHFTAADVEAAALPTHTLKPIKEQCTTLLSGYCELSPWEPVYQRVCESVLVLKWPLTFHNGCVSPDAPYCIQQWHDCTCGPPAGKEASRGRAFGPMGGTDDRLKGFCGGSWGEISLFFGKCSREWTTRISESESLKVGIKFLSDQATWWRFTRWLVAGAAQRLLILIIFFLFSSIFIFIPILCCCCYRCCCFWLWLLWIMKLW